MVMLSPYLGLKFTQMMIRLVGDPTRLDAVFSITDALLKDRAASEQFGKVLAIAQVKRAATARLRTPVLDLQKLKSAPVGTLAERAYSFFTRYHLDPGALPRKEPHTDVEWLSTHLYETHDLWHVLTGFAPDVAGEMGLQAFYATQVDGPLAGAILSAGFLNTVLKAQDEQTARLAAVARGYTLGKHCKNIVALDFEPLMLLPLAQVREQLGMVVDPAFDNSGLTVASSAQT
jgi:ubiquinone biosynthesis protein Coq4